MHTTLFIFTRPIYMQYLRLTALFLTSFDILLSPSDGAWSNVACFHWFLQHLWRRWQRSTSLEVWSVLSCCCCVRFPLQVLHKIDICLPRQAFRICGQLCRWNGTEAEGASEPEGEDGRHEFRPSAIACTWRRQVAKLVTVSVTCYIYGARCDEVRKYTIMPKFIATNLNSTNIILLELRLFKLTYVCECGFKLFCWSFRQVVYITFYDFCAQQIKTRRRRDRTRAVQVLTIRQSWKTSLRRKCRGANVKSSRRSCDIKVTGCMHDGEAKEHTLVTGLSEIVLSSPNPLVTRQNLDRQNLDRQNLDHQNY